MGNANTVHGFDMDGVADLIQKHPDVDDDDLLELVMESLFWSQLEKLSLESPTISKQKVKQIRLELRDNVRKQIKQRGIDDAQSIPGKFQVSDHVGLDTMKLTQQLSAEAIKDHGCFRIAVSGGSFSK
eukprot:398177_1